MLPIRVAVLAAICLLASARPSAAACEVTFNARTQRWDLTACKGRADVDMNGRPTLLLDSRTTVDVVVTEANPLLYVASIGEVTVEKIPAAESLQAIFLSLGGVFQGIVKDMAMRTLSVKPTAAAAPDPLLVALVKKIKVNLRDFLIEEADLVTAVQRLEFVDTVTVAAPVKSLELWNEDFNRLRLALDEPAAATIAATLDPQTKSKVQGEIDEARKEASALLDKREAVIKSVTIAKLMARRACRAGTRTPGATPSPSSEEKCAAEPSGRYTVERRLTPWRGSRTAPWDEIATYPLTVARQSLYAANVVTDLPEKIETKFRIGSRHGSLFDVGIGLTTSEIEDPSFAAVTDPADASRKVVTRTGAAQRSAVKTLLATYAFSHDTEDWRLRPFAEFGTSLESEKPGIFGGLALGLGKYIRVAIGMSRQRVTGLDGQEEGVTVVSEDKEIKTRHVWQNGGYWSISFNITGLPLFKKDD